jgi:nucleoside-diphosphate-sugar epimerase
MVKLPQIMSLNYLSIKTKDMSKKILVTGANGQIGAELVELLYKLYGKQNIIASSRRKENYMLDGVFEILDVLNRQSITDVIKKYGIEEIYHLAGILSARGEQNPQECWNVNVNGLINVLEVSRENGIKKIFFPSSIAVFGDSSPKDMAPQQTTLEPSSMYGVCKVSCELLCMYYYNKYGIDIRGLRYPGIISNKILPGGGTSDYAVDIYYQALKNKHFECFVRKDTVLPMMYMPDCLRGSIELMEADPSKLKHRVNYNFSAMSFSAEELYLSVKKLIPELTVEYKPDFRQKIADSWTNSMDDSFAREEWGWKPEYDLDAMSLDMINVLKNKI